jgi:hypothetical protein
LIIRFVSVSIPSVSIAEIKRAVGELSPAERHELMRWLEAEEAGYGDIPEEALVQNAAEVFRVLDEEEESRGTDAQGSSR